MRLGHKQKALVDLGKSKGFVNSNDLSKFYKVEERKRVMNSLVALGYFHNEELSKNGLKVFWRIKS